MGSLSCSLTSLRSLPVGLRAGTVAANNIGSRGTFFVFPFAFTGVFMTEEINRTDRKGLKKLRKERLRRGYPLLVIGGQRSEGPRTRRLIQEGFLRQSRIARTRTTLASTR